MKSSFKAHLVEPNIITEMRVEIQFGIASIRCPTTVRVSTEYMDNPMLYFFRDSHEIHIISTSRRTLYLKAGAHEERCIMRKYQAYLEVVAIILIKALQTLDQQEIRSEPCEKRSQYYVTEESMHEPHVGLTKRQLLGKIKTYKLDLASLNSHQTCQSWNHPANSRLHNVGRVHLCPKGVLGEVSTF